MSAQIAGHNLAAKQTNRAPFLFSINSTYHQIREITRFASVLWRRRPAGARTRLKKLSLRRASA
jgi:hypothetical protein